MMGGVVIVGAGQAGYQAADSLRQEGYTGSVTLIGEESHLPYQRPPLSKQYLLGNIGAERIRFRNQEYFTDKNINLWLETRVTRLHPEQHEIEFAFGDRLGYEQLILATGARVRTLVVPGADSAGVCYLRTLDDVDRIQQLFDATDKVLIIGAGFIGLEVAAAARSLGKHVTVIEALDRVMARVVSPILSEHYAKVHRAQGVELIMETVVSEFSTKGSVVTANCDDGRVFDAGIAIVGTGVLPNIDLAEKARLDCNNGILVDEYSRTSVADIFAAGDCASYAHPFAGTSVRLESVQNAADQARTAAATIAGKIKPYTTIPRFWSDQYDHKLQMIGLSAGCDTHVVRGDQGSGKFSVFIFAMGNCALLIRSIDQRIM